MIWTFVLVIAAWVFFRAESLTHAIDYLLGWMRFEGMTPSSRMLAASSTILIVLLVDSVLRFEQPKSIFRHQGVRWVTYAVATIGVLLAWGDESTQFIYFQF